MIDYQQRARGPMPFLSSPELTVLVNGWNAVNQSGEVQPSANPYALQNDTLALLKSLVEQIRPRQMVEFGSGASTSVLGEWASSNNAHLLSLEHDRGWADRISGQVLEAGLSNVSVMHKPLAPSLYGLRLFLTYRSLREQRNLIANAGLMLLDGPHMSGREVVLRFSLAHARPGAVLVIDDFHHHAVREMLISTPLATAKCFEGVAVEANSHGLYVLRCVKPAPTIQFPTTNVGGLARSYWRSWIDFRSHGLGL